MFSLFHKLKVNKTINQYIQESEQIKEESQTQLNNIMNELDRKYQEDIQKYEQEYQEELKKLDLPEPEPINIVESTQEELDDEFDRQNKIYESFRTNCGDVILTDIVREPDLTGIFTVWTEDSISKRYKKKIKKNVNGYYVILDGEKVYFKKHHPQFESTFN